MIEQIGCDNKGTTVDSNIMDTINSKKKIKLNEKLSSLIDVKIKIKNGLTTNKIKENNIVSFIESKIDQLGDNLIEFNFKNNIGNNIFIKRNPKGTYTYNDSYSHYREIDQTTISNLLIKEELSEAVIELKKENIISSYEIIDNIGNHELDEIYIILEKEDVKPSFKITLESLYIKTLNLEGFEGINSLNFSKKIEELVIPFFNDKSIKKNIL